MPKFKYRGDAPVLFSHYRDVTDPDNPVTLTAEPGKTYDIEQASGYDVIQPDGQFTPLELPMPPDDHWEAVGTAEDKPAAKPKPATKDEENG